MKDHRQRYWSGQELARLAELRRRGLPVKAIARRLGRTYQSVAYALHHHQADQLRDYTRPDGEAILALKYGDRVVGEPARLASLDDPLPTVTAAGKTFGLVEPFVMHLTHHGPARVSRVVDPLPTVTGANRGEQALCEPFVIGQQSGAVPRPVSEPLPTLATGGAISFVEPFLVRYNGTGGPIPVGEPIPTVTARDRFGLVDVDGLRLDVLFRMLQPSELALAQGFPAGYRFCGNRTQQVRQIGNAVAVGMARALCLALLGVVRRRAA